MFIQYKNTARIFVVAASFMIIPSLYGAPVVTDISFEGKSTAVGDIVLATGRNFQVKQDASPLLYDRTSFAHESNGLNDHQASFVEGQKIDRPEDDPSTLWVKASNNSGEANYPTVTSAGVRHKYQKTHYLLEGLNSFLGWPAAYGGTTTPSGNDKLYLSWWFKLKYNPSYYWQWKIDNVNGEFLGRVAGQDFGETVVIDSGYTAKVLQYSNGVLHLVFDKPLDPYKSISSTYLKGQVIKGQNSGATATLAVGNEGTSGAFMSPGSNKFIRIWEDSSGSTGFKLAWTQMNLTVRKKNSGQNFVSNAKFDWPTNTWMHFEVQLDMNKSVKIKVDNETLYDMDLTLSDGAEQNLSDFSPTIALLGFNGDNQPLQESHVSEIYMDKEFQRVVIADKPVWTDVTHYEVQYIEAWDDERIQFKYNPGSFETPSNLYVYVFDNDGNVNNVGKKLCGSCGSQPNPPNLSVN